MLKISNRLQTIVEMVEKTNVVCDVGSDHGYVPIFLINNNIAKYVIASDINIKPLESMKNNIKCYLDSNKISNIDIRLGQGLNVINKNEADIIIITGMGYDTISEILNNINEYSFKYLILSPQSKYYEFRKYVFNLKLDIINEQIVIDNNKYYFIFKIKKTNKKIIYENECFYKYGKILLETKNLVLKEYIKKDIFKYNNILKNLNINSKIYSEINNKLKIAFDSLEYYK